VRVKAYRLDVRESQQVDAVVDQVVEDFDTIDVLVNNAGVTHDNLVAQMSNEEWDEVIATNLTGPFYMCRAVLTTMLAARFGRIINISSVVIGGATGQANYCAAKSGLHGLTKALAKEYGRKGITANVVVPGFFETEMTVDTMPQGLRDFWKTYSLVPKGRGGELAELNACIMFLASKEASFINGQELRVTAGLDWTP
jgi:NAD(P)-dependent dehydrogenase (short-subunit alcohol dehydrogenase family)